MCKPYMWLFNWKLFSGAFGFWYCLLVGNSFKNIVCDFFSSLAASFCEKTADCSSVSKTSSIDEQLGRMMQHCATRSFIAFFSVSLSLPRPGITVNNGVTKRTPMKRSKLFNSLSIYIFSEEKMWITPDKGNDELHFVELAEYPMKTTEIQFSLSIQWYTETENRVVELTNKCNQIG